MIKYFLTLIGVFATVFALHASSTEVKTGADTTAILKSTDSLATIMLRDYDEKSQRQTGVPRALEHFDKTYIVNSQKKLLIVNYTFNQQKFYGSDHDLFALSTGFPDRFSIVYNITTKTVRYIPEG
jgi:hypothetical protein